MGLHRVQGARAMQASSIPSDSVITVVVQFTEEEREYLLQKVKGSMAVARSNMQDINISEPDREFYAGQYALAVRILTKLGV